MGEINVDELTTWALYLINDQCKGLLNMTDDHIAKLMGVTRPTLSVRKARPETITLGDVKRLEDHLRFIKAAILTTESAQTS